MATEHATVPSFRPVGDCKLARLQLEDRGGDCFQDKSALLSNRLLTAGGTVNEKWMIPAWRSYMGVFDNHLSAHDRSQSCVREKRGDRQDTPMSAPTRSFRMTNGPFSRHAENCLLPDDGRVGGWGWMGGAIRSRRFYLLFVDLGDLKMGWGGRVGLRVGGVRRGKEVR